MKTGKVFFLLIATGLAACGPNGAVQVPNAKPGLGVNGQTFKAKQQLVDESGSPAFTNENITVSLETTGNVNSFVVYYGNGPVTITDAGGGVYSDGGGKVTMQRLPAGAPGSSDEVMGASIDINDGAFDYNGFVVFGHQTKASFINSRAGSATYNGAQTGMVNIYRDDGSTMFLLGDVALTANFGANTVSGTIGGNSFTDNHGSLTYPGPSTGAHLMVTNGTISGNSFSGNIVFEGGVQTDTGLSSTGTINLNGNFYDALGNTIAGNFYGNDAKWSAGASNAIINGGFIGQ